MTVLTLVLKSNKISAHPNFTIRVRTPTPSGLNSEFSDRGQVPFHQDAGYLLDDAKDTVDTLKDLVKKQNKPLEAICIILRNNRTPWTKSMPGPATKCR